MSSNAKKVEQLGMPQGTANARLRKNLTFHLAKQLGQHFCFRCEKEIETVEEFSVEHKEPWLDSENPSDMFFNLENIAFSHLKCNIASGRRPLKKYFTPEAKQEALRATARKSQKKYCTKEVRRA